MIYAYHAAIADGVGLPLIAFQFPKAFGPDFPPETLARLATIPQIIGLKEASFDTTKTVETIAAARALPRKLGIMTGSDTFICEAMVMGCDGALIGFAGTATAELIDMQRAVAALDFVGAFAIWSRWDRWHAMLARADPRLSPAHEGSAQDAGPDCLTRRSGRRSFPSTMTSDAELARLATIAGLLGERSAARLATEFQDGKGRTTLRLSR